MKKIDSVFSPALIELALFCDGNNETFARLSNLFIEALTNEIEPGLRALKPREEIESLVMGFHLAGGSIQSISREAFFQNLLPSCDDIWLLDRLLGRPGINNPIEKKKANNRFNMISK